MPSHTLNTLNAPLNAALDAESFTVGDLYCAALTLGVNGSDLIGAISEPSTGPLMVDKSAVTMDDVEAAAGYLKLPPMVLMGFMMNAAGKLPESV